jgi:hypothetical protein
VTSLALPAASDALAALQKSLGPLDAQAAGLLVAAATDLSLVIDGEGVIREATFGSADLADEGCDTWLGRPWVDTVTVESRPKIAALLKDAAPGAVTRWRQVNHVSPTGTDLPVRYAAMQLAKDGQILVLEDMLGLSDRVPKFVKRFGFLRGQIEGAVEAYAEEVRAGRFPADEHTYQPI